MAHAVLDELLAVTSGIGLCWLGNLSWLLRAEGRLIGFDLDLDRDYRAAATPIPTAEIAESLDVHLITHGHEDHFSSITSAILAERSACLFVLPANCVDKARALNIAPPRIRVARPGEPFELPGMSLRPLRALHGGPRFTVFGGANLDDCGYHFTFGGVSFLQPGDSVLLQDHLDLDGVDVLFVSPTVHNTHIDRSCILIDALQPRHIFPQHYGTYTESDTNLFWTRGYPDELAAALPAALRDRYHKLVMGEVFVLR
ncbi:MAG: MBL fold metallo-hydrolase [Planctomycetes bacterium]|nr:MBL fold metallo-hydrolase [Planctomycetota bacterium]